MSSLQYFQRVLVPSCALATMFLSPLQTVQSYCLSNTKLTFTFVTVDIILNQTYNGLMSQWQLTLCTQHTSNTKLNFWWQRSQSVSLLKGRENVSIFCTLQPKTTTVPDHTLLSADCTNLKPHFIYNNFTEAAIAICSAVRSAAQ